VIVAGGGGTGMGAAVARVVGGLGGDVHVLDLSLVTLDEKLGQLRKNAERYRTVQD